MVNYSPPTPTGWTFAELVAPSPGQIPDRNGHVLVSTF